MTGYGIEYSLIGGKKIGCWIKTLNSKFLEIYFNIPSAYFDLEPAMRKEIQKRIKRGKVEVFIREEKDRFLFSLRRVKSEDVFSVFLSALMKLEESREKEGEFIRHDLLQRISRIKEITDEIEAMHSQFPEKIRAILKERVQQVALEIGMGDIPQDIIDKAGVVHIIRKSDIAEEILRIRAHIEAFEEEVQGEGDGKKLMFVAQELLREFNTIGTKSIDTRISEKVIEGKLEIERIREQLYNVE